MVVDQPSPNPSSPTTTPLSPLNPAFPLPPYPITLPSSPPSHPVALPTSPLPRLPGPLELSSSSPLSPPCVQNSVLALAATVMPPSSVKPPHLGPLASIPALPQLEVGSLHHSPYQVSFDPLSFPLLCAESWESPKRKAKQVPKLSHNPPFSSPNYLNPFAPLSFSAILNHSHSSSSVSPSPPNPPITDPPPPSIPPSAPSLPPSPDLPHVLAPPSPAEGALLTQGVSPKSL